MQCQNTLPPTLIHSRRWCSRDWRVTEKCQAAASVIQAIRSSSESTFHCHLQWLLDCAGWTCGLASKVNGPHTNGLLLVGPYLHIVSWFWRGSYCPYHWDSSNLTLWSYSLICVSRQVAVCLDITLNLYEMQLFFRILHWFCLISNLRPTWMVCGTGKDACLTYSFLTENICFGLSCFLIKFGHGVFPYLV